MIYYSNRKENNAEIGTRSMEYFYDNCNRVVIWGGLWKDVWGFELEKPLNVQSLIAVCESLEDKNAKSNANIKDLFCEIS